MCIQIDSRCVILNILQAKGSVDLSQLTAFAVAFKARVNRSYVDISDASVFGAIEEYAAILSLTDNTITPRDDFGAFADSGFLDRTVNRQFPADVQKHLHECAAATR